MDDEDILELIEEKEALEQALRQALREGWHYGDDFGERCNYCGEEVIHPKEPRTREIVCAHTPECLMTLWAELVGGINQED